MKKYFIMAAGSIASATLMMVAVPAAAGGVDVGINIGLPGFFPAPVYVPSPPVYVQPGPVYVQPEPVYVETPPFYIEQEHDWQGPRWHEWHHEGRHRGHRDHERDEHDDDDD